MSLEERSTLASEMLALGVDEKFMTGWQGVADGMRTASLEPVKAVKDEGRKPALSESPITSRATTPQPSSAKALQLAATKQLCVSMCSRIGRTAMRKKAPRALAGLASQVSPAVAVMAQVWYGFLSV